eukprot:gnl/TRDRNA2_/TRDRNA2_74815_c0_seq1.p1 gnl/TRDRNA2_/TRDRNA2_74815_c0~~gnl/TRDRNA2_/TRDRNA2_74815_c0_seq1.p1  ORF type:complete len:314 (+),score=42.29 gnl/TRDRNA2_/TRDRNA2_74815_c0_seq1:82-942(+)
MAEQVRAVLPPSVFLALLLDGSLDLPRRPPPTWSAAVLDSRGWAEEILLHSRLKLVLAVQAGVSDGFGFFDAVFPWLRNPGPSDLKAMEATPEYWSVGSKIVSFDQHLRPFFRNMSYPRRCQEYFEKVHPAAWSNSWCHGFAALPFISVPLYLLNSAYNRTDTTKSNQNRLDLCLSKPHCVAGLNAWGSELMAAVKFALRLRAEETPGVPSGAFVSACPSGYSAWHQLHDDNGVSNTEHVRRWLSAAKAVFEEHRGGPPAPKQAATDAYTITWQRPEMQICPECCR